MSSPYPVIDRWVIPETALTITVAGVRRAGGQGNESGAFWLGDRGTLATLRAVVLPTGPGVEERPGQWRVSAEVFGVISRWAKPRALTLLGIAHTHARGVPVRPSWADRRRSVQVPGLLAVIIGNGGADRDHHQWGWYVYDAGDYRELPLGERTSRIQFDPDLPVDISCADCVGVRTMKNENP